MPAAASVSAESASTDSVMHPNGVSFVRFESRAPFPTDRRPRWRRSPRVAHALARLRRLAFDIEFFVADDGESRSSR